MNTIWKIANLERTNDTDAVVTTAYYQVYAIDGEYIEGTHETVDFEGDPSSDGFIAFDELTEDVVIGWVKDKFGDEGVTGIEDAIAEKIEAQKNSPTVAGVPWDVEAVMGEREVPEYQVTDQSGLMTLIETLELRISTLEANDSHIRCHIRKKGDVS